MDFLLKLLTILFGRPQSPKPKLILVPLLEPTTTAAVQAKPNIQYMLTFDQLKAMMPQCTDEHANAYLQYINSAMEEAQINTRLRVSAFIAQLATESCELRYMEEIASGKAYEGRLDLGNTQPGDGPRYKGRGPIQLTGRKNYTEYGAALGVDLVNNPELAATPQVGFRIAGLFWAKHGLNTLADVQDFITITRRINGGLNGLDSRKAFYTTALSVLS